MRKLLLVFGILCVWLSPTVAQGNWELKKSGNGIEVYTRKPATGNLKELRVICELDATKAQLISTLQDITHYPEWVYSNKKSVILKTTAPQGIIYYTQSHLPWPIKDRDLVIQLDINQNAEVLIMEAKTLSGYVPVNDKYIRVPYSAALWKVTPTADNKLKVDYTFSVDPGGSIPAWIVNATLATGPYNSFLKLKEMMLAKNTVKR